MNDFNPKIEKYKQVLYRNIYLVIYLYIYLSHLFVILFLHRFHKILSNYKKKRKGGHETEEKQTEY